MSANPLRNVTCATCRKKFRPARRDQRYCSAACRQRAHRARAQVSDLDRAVEAARRAYWSAVAEKAKADGVSMSRVVTAQAQFVDAAGNVFVGGPTGGLGPGARHVGHTRPVRPGWASWGLEAAGAPWSPPPRGERSAS